MEPSAGQLAKQARCQAVADVAVQTDQVAVALTQLSSWHRAMIYRAYYLGRTTTEIAAELGIDDRLVKDELHRALRELRSSLHRAENCAGVAFPGPASRC